MLLVLCATFMFFIQRAKKGRVSSIRRLAGLDAIEEAVGRATEMGRPVHFSTGFGHYGLTNPSYASQHLAGLSVLGYVSELVAERKATLIASIAHPEMIPLYEDIIKQAYIRRGAPELFKPDTVRFLSSYQLAFAAGVMGLLLKEKVASSVIIGTFMAESLLFSEAGAVAGCLQVAGTANVSQLPFFAGICDYTLIGEDIYAAGAYVSKDPVLVGSIAGQDVGKILAMLLIVLAVAFASLRIGFLTQLLRT